MEFLKQWTFCVCVSLVCASVLSLFAPKGRMNGFYKMLISLFIFISFIYPFKDFKGVEFSIPEISVQEETANPYKKMAENQIKSALEEAGIIGADVACEVNYDYKSGEIELKSAQISVSDEYDKEEVGRIVFEKLGVNARVIYVGQ